MDPFAVARFAIGGAFLAVAAGSDLRTRRVRDSLWIGLGSVGLVLLALQLALESTDLTPFALLGSAAILFYVIFFGKPLFDEDGFHSRPARLGLFLAAAALFVYPLAAYSARAITMPPTVLELYSMPVMIGIYQGFYRARILHGGADAKALVALTLLVPTYPNVSPFPLIAVDPRVAGVLRTAFPFSLVVWANAALLSLAVPVVLLVANAIRGDLAVPQALLGYRAPIDPFPPHAWLMERITDRGDHILVLFPKRDTDRAEDLARLRASGIDRVWVTPQTPFMVPLLCGFLLAFLVGNLLLGILRLFG